MQEYIGEVEVITNIGTTPNERGLTTEQFKAKFDEGLKNFVAWFNDTHKTEFEDMVSHKNLLHNWDWRNPVNQRGQTSYGQSETYTIDRWKLGWFPQESPTTVNVAAGCLSIVTSPDRNGGITQKIENLELLVGKTVTLSIMDSNGVIYAKSDIVSMPMDNAASRVHVYDSDGVTALGYIQLYSSDISLPPYVRINVYSGKTMKIQAVKLELGSTSTLANDPPADYGEQLALCQRYYQQHTTNTVADMDLRPSMRITPTKTAITGGYAYSADL